jgi:hypothetical protein
VVEPSTCEKASKISFCFSGGMPMPVSLTAKVDLAAVFAFRGQRQRQRHAPAR